MKPALITGASGGIGLATAQLMAQQSYQLTLVARSENKLTELISELPGAGHQALVADLSTEVGMQKIVDHLNQNRYSVLVNNAGIGIYGRFEVISIADQIRMLRLNCEALTRLSHAYLQQAENGDALINVSSFLATASFPSASAYAGTKGYVQRLSESLWYEFKKKGVFVCGFCPGVTKTAFHIEAGQDDAAFPDVVKQSPEQVAKELVRALHKRKKPQVVSGVMNRLMLFGFRFLSRKAIVNIMGSLSPVLKS